MKDLIIVGASGFGLEVCWLASKLNYNVVGYLDDSYDVVNNNNHYGKPILGKIDDWFYFEKSNFVIAVGSPRTRKKIFEKMTYNNLCPRFETLIDPTAQIGDNIKVGDGSIICACVIITTEVVIGKQCIINLNTTIGHECKLGDFVTIAPGVSVSGRVNIGNLVEIGTGAAIRQGLCVDDGSMLGMGGILTKNIPQNSLFYGNPAKFVREIS